MLRRVLTPLPFRGDLIAAGAVALAVGVLAADARMQDAWPAGARLAFVGLAAAIVLALAWLAPVEGASPRRYASALLAAAFPLAAVALAELSRVLGGGGLSLTWRPAGGSTAWILGALALLYGAAALRRNSALCTLLAAVSGVLAVANAWEWAFDADSLASRRWILLTAILVFAFAAIALRDRHRRHAVALVDAAGLSAVMLGAISAFGPDPARAWDVVLPAVGFGLVAYAAADREPGPAWIGAVVLGLFVALAGDGASLLWWPLLLVVLGGGAVAAGLRPTTPAPPPPDADAPVADPRPLQREDRT